MPNEAPRNPEQSELIADLKQLSSTTPNLITRNFYRENSKFSERQWQKFYPKFNDFLEAAGLHGSAYVASFEPESDEVVGDERTITLPKTRIQTLDELLEHCKVDTSTWKVDTFKVNKWEMGTADGPVGAKRIIVEPLFQVKATLKRRVEIISIQREIDALKAEAKLHAHSPLGVTHRLVDTPSGNMLEINLPDAHFGKLAWAQETGHDYTTDIAQSTFLRAIETILERTKGYRFDLIVFVVGNDILQADDTENRTTRGTYVDTDGRYYRNFGVVRRTVTLAIERLRQIAPVKVVMVRGNHDNLSVWHLGDSLECYFHNYKDVQIDNAPTERKYLQFGKVMLMFTHGDKGKRSKYPLLMATEQPEMFGSTKFREAHTGHTHETKLDEQYGVRVRVLPALCPPDAWHAEMGFVGNLRAAEGFVWNREEGLIAQVFHNEDAIAA